MKKILTAALFVAATAFTAKANDDINARAVASFNQVFKNATNVVWTEAESRTEVAFDWNNQHIKVFYTADGEQTAILKTVQVAQMPTLVQLKLSDYGKEYSIGEALEMNNSLEGLSYYVYLNNDRKNMIVKINSNGEASVIKKIKK